MRDVSRRPELRQARARRTRDNVLDAALRRFATDGFRGASVAGIASDAGVTDAGLLYHFPTKEELLLAVLKQHNMREWRLLGELYGDGGLDFLRRLAGWGEVMEQDENFTSLHLILSAEHLLDDSKVNEYFRQRYDRGIGALTWVFATAKQKGEIREDVDAEAEARALYAVMDGSRLQYFYTDGRASMATIIRRYVNDLIDRATRL
jgi:AcrR family transcriptional regulator